MRDILESMPQSEVLSLLPETVESLEALTSLGQETLAEHLRAWQRAQAARLRHLTFQLTTDQLDVINEALDGAVTGVTQTDANPNRRGNALHAICRDYLDGERP